MLGLTNLEWFPKPFGPGDTDGQGAQRLLGQPDLDLHQLLVRETAQNSWDARLSGSVPTFELRLRDLNPDVRDVLQWNVFRDYAENLGLWDALRSTNLRAVEVVDRGTKGLGGLTRNDIEVPPGTITDFADLVLTVGAPPDQEAGGGTYGFGKTAAYMASQCSTIIIWSRARGVDGDIVERFIASAMGPSFSMDGERFTGRQWWGVPAEPTQNNPVRFEPVEGDPASALGREVFARHFEEDETGTSILILQPVGGEDLNGMATAYRDAIVTNLWPKLDENQPPQWRMNVRLYLGTELVPLAVPDPAVWDARRECLDAVREVQMGAAQSNPLVLCSPIELQRPRELLGHLALRPVIERGKDDWNGVTLMRHKAELVVTSSTMVGTAEAQVRWVGVFKPVAAVDAAFAASEPPAHDAWHPEGMKDPAMKKRVNVALKRIREATRDFLTPATEAPAAGGTLSTGALAAALGSLMGGAPGSGAVPRPSRQGSSGAAARPKVQVRSILPLDRDGRDRQAGRQRTVFTLELVGPSSAVVTVGSLAIAVEGGALRADDALELLGWGGEGHAVGGGFRAYRGRPFSAVIAYPEGLAVDVTFVAEPDA